MSRFESDRRRWTTGAGFALAAILAGVPASPAGAGEIDLGAVVTGQPPGIRQTERLAKKAEALIDSVSAAQVQVRTTLAAHRDLVFGGATDLRKPYRALDREIDRAAKKREAVRGRADAARAEATDYFRAWAGTLPLIEDAELRTRSEERLRDSKARFDGIVEAGLRAAAAYEPFLSRLRDQWNYLGHDLNRSGIESLRPDGEQVAAEGDRLLAEIDESLRQSRDYVASIRSRRPPPPPTPAPAAEPEAPPSGR
jgi:hypothetical protein